MKESLKTKLNNFLKAQYGKVVPINQLELLCKQWGYKISNYERRLRHSESPNIGTQTKNGAIVGYYWKTTSLNDISPATAPQKHTTDDCPSWNAFKVYCPDCRLKLQNDLPGFNI